MKPARKYPWNDFTINDWLAVDDDNHVCFVESWREKGVPGWISIPNHYLSNLHRRLEEACSQFTRLGRKTIATNQEIADKLGIFFLSTSDEYGEKIRYVYDAVPETPRLVDELPAPFPEIAEYIHIPRKKLIAKDAIFSLDWVQGSEIELDTLNMSNGVLVETLDSSDGVWLPGNFKHTKCEVIRMRFLPNSKLEKEATTTFPTFVVWERYQPFFSELIRRLGILLSAQCDSVSVDSDGIPSRTALFHRHGIPIGCYTFGPPGGDSFLLDHGEINLWLAAENLHLTEFMQVLIEVCKCHDVYLYSLPKAGFVQSLKKYLHRLNTCKVPKEESRFQGMTMCYPPIPVNCSPHVSYLFHEGKNG